MAKTNKPDGPDGQNGATTNIHLELPREFHRRIKMLCVIKGSTLKAYGLAALEEKVARDDEEMRQVK